MTSHLRAMRRHLPYGITIITQCYLPPDTSERTPCVRYTTWTKQGKAVSNVLCQSCLTLDLLTSERRPQSNQQEGDSMHPVCMGCFSRTTCNQSCLPELLARFVSLGHYNTTVWWRGVVVSALSSINEVNQHRARLLLGWVTVCGQVNRLGM